MISDLPTDVASNVRAIMARRRVSGKQVGEAIGLSHAAAHRRLIGEVAFDVDELQAVARLLGVTRASLLGDDVEAIERGEVPA